MKKIFTLISIISVSAGSVMAQPTPNAGFETWTTQGTFFTYAAATGWDSPNSQTATVGTFVCIKATAAADIHSGTAAVKLISKSIAGLGNSPGVITTGTLPSGFGGNITGGIPYTLSPDSIIGWYKYTPVSGDNGFVSFMLFGSASGNTDTIAMASFNTPAATVGTYTRFAAHLVYRNSHPVVNSMWLISSSRDGNNPVLGSTMFVDDINLVWASTLNVAEQAKLELTVGPNPASDHVIIKNTLNPKALFVLYDITGRKIVEEKITNTSNFIDINSYPAGLYIYSIKDENGTALKSGKLVIHK